MSYENRMCRCVVDGVNFPADMSRYAYYFYEHSTPHWCIFTLHTSPTNQQIILNLKRFAPANSWESSEKLENSSSV